MQVTIQNLEIVRVDAEQNLILVKGAVPGPKKVFSNIEVFSKGLIAFTEVGKEDHTNGYSSCL